MDTSADWLLTCFKFLVVCALLYFPESQSSMDEPKIAENFELPQQQPHPLTTKPNQHPTPSQQNQGSKFFRKKLDETNSTLYVEADG